MKKSKFLNNLIIIMIAVLALGTIAQAANIVWVSDRVPPKGYDPNRVPEAGFLELLRNAGHTVDYKGELNSFEWVGPEDDLELFPLSDELQYWRELDDDKIAELEAADLIIFSRLASSGAYDDADATGYDERILWNSITTPMICMNPHLTRTGYDKWGWMDYQYTATLWNDATGSMPVNPHVSTVLDPTHAIFAGIDLSDPTQVKLLIDDYNCEGASATSIGNGTLLLTRNVDLAIMIATWEAGVEFFDGVGYFAGGPRMFFAAAAGAKSAEFQGSFGDGDYNLTPDGEIVFLNAVKYMLPATSMVAHWKLEDNANDELGTSDGTLNNIDASMFVAGLTGQGKAIDFNAGTDSAYIAVPDNDIVDFDSTTSFTLSALINFDYQNLNGEIAYIQKGFTGVDPSVGGEGKWYVMAFKNNEARFAIDDNVNKTQLGVDVSGIFPSNQWVHMVGVRDMDEDSLKLYMNGELIGSMEDVTERDISSSLPLIIGNNQSQDRAFEGMIDDVQLYNTALSAEKVKTLFDSYGITTGVEDEPGVKLLTYTLMQNYPNPFNPTTQIQYTLGKNTKVEIAIYDLLGRKVATLVNEYQNGGSHRVVWDASEASAGVYLYQMKTNDVVESKKMILVK